MVSSAGSPRTITVKRRGSKRYAAEGDEWDGQRRDAADRAADRDDPCADPARAKLVPVRAQ
ncbi:MAG TPA: hypothetical protein VMF87_08220 [Streptosporangiaceae bacterium]|jgi:hypothetical protein|nr:hypothetical protein [Streptosporangiaceae bacterium]